MYTAPDGTAYYVVDGHVHWWDASNANYRNERNADGWIRCFYDYHKNLSPADYVWPFELYQQYPEERMIQDLFVDGYVDKAIFLPTALTDFYTNGFNTTERDAHMKERHPDRFILNSCWDPRDEEAGLRHALPATAVARGAAGAGTANAGLPQQAVDCGAGEVNTFALRQEVGEMAIITPSVAGAGQSEHARADRSGAASRGLVPTVPMGQGGQALLAYCGDESADMTDRESQQRRRCFRREESRVNPRQDLPPLLLFLGQGYRLPGHSPRVTESLNS